MSDLEAWLKLARTPGLGAATAETLLHHFGSAEQALAASAAQWQRLGLPRHPARAGPEIEADVERASEWLSRDTQDHHLLTLASDAYPPLLRRLQDAPVILFVRGDPGLLAEPQLAVVGSRNPSAGGRDNAFEFASFLSRCGLLITSGLALGIDSQAHRGALEGGEATIAVCGTGLDSVYPRGNMELAERIAEQGALVSEFFPGTAPQRANFPRRNRLISGLALGVLVVEAALRSGSLITARLAAEQGREVFAIPGSIHNPMARGCHRLIRDGAKLVESAEDVLAELGPLVASLSASTVPGTSADPSRDDPPGSLGKEYAQLLEACGSDPVSVDQLAERTKLTAAEVSSMLLILELQGYVESGAGGRYARAGKRF
jgi:DNA processing protein